MAGKPILEACWIDTGPLLRRYLHFVPVLSDAEMAKADLFRTDLDRRRYIVRHGWLREQLARRLGQAPANLAFNRNDFGKPGLVNETLGFSLSHSQGVALLVCGPIAAIGCDIEWRDPSFDPLPVAARFFSGSEQRAFADLAPALRLAGFYHGWTRKEAYTKALGCGLSMSLDTFDVEIDPEKPARLLRGCDGWAVASFEPLTGFQAAVAAPGTWQLRETKAGSGLSVATRRPIAEEVQDLAMQ